MLLRSVVCVDYFLQNIRQCLSALSLVERFDSVHSSSHSGRDNICQDERVQLQGKQRPKSIKGMLYSQILRSIAC